MSTIIGRLRTLGQSDRGGGATGHRERDVGFRAANGREGIAGAGRVEDRRVVALMSAKLGAAHFDSGSLRSDLRTTAIEEITKHQVGIKVGTEVQSLTMTLGIERHSSFGGDPQLTGRHGAIIF